MNVVVIHDRLEIRSIPSLVVLSFACVLNIFSDYRMMSVCFDRFDKVGGEIGLK
jgi:hypothetical protein